MDFVITSSQLPKVFRSRSRIAPTHIIKNNILIVKMLKHRHHKFCKPQKKRKPKFKKRQPSSFPRKSAAGARSCPCRGRGCAAPSYVMTGRSTKEGGTIPTNPYTEQTIYSCTKHILNDMFKRKSPTVKNKCTHTHTHTLKRLLRIVAVQFNKHLALA